LNTPAKAMPHLPNAEPDGFQEFASRNYSHLMS
jgi:hypothetical protein